MSPCSYCANSGWSSIGMMCRCPIGAALRMQANRALVAPWSSDDVTMPKPIPVTPSQSVSQHAADDDLTHPTMAERLRSIGYREPVLPKPAHTCRSGCGVLVSACGTMCAACTEESAALAAVAAVTPGNGVDFVMLAIGAIAGALAMMVAMCVCGVVK